MCSSTGVDFGPQTLFQKNNSWYVGLLVIACEFWDVGACPKKSFPESNCLPCWKMLLQKIGEMERVQYEGNSCPSCPPWMRTEGVAVCNVYIFVYICLSKSVHKFILQVFFPFCENTTRERALRIVYRDTESSFHELLAIDNSISTYQRILKLLMTEIC